jgi:hypothetical protein
MESNQNDGRQDADDRLRFDEGGAKSGYAFG